MLIEIKIDETRVLRKSDSGKYIKNLTTGQEYIEATDLTNEERKRRWLKPYEFIETDKVIEETV